MSKDMEGDAPIHTTADAKKAGQNFAKKTEQTHHGGKAEASNVGAGV